MDEKSIITVTQGGLLYRDNAGVVQWLEWKTCHARLQTTSAPLGKFDRRYVGARTHMYVRFFTANPVIFIFDDRAWRDVHLIFPLARFGFYTCDEYYASSVLRV